MKHNEYSIKTINKNTEAENSKELETINIIYKVNYEIIYDSDSIYYLLFSKLSPSLIWLLFNLSNLNFNLIYSYIET